MKLVFRSLIVGAAIALTLASQAKADRWFGCGKIIKLTSYTASEIRFDIEGASYAGICQYSGSSDYGHHKLVKTPENQWIFAMHLAAAVAGKSVRLFSSDTSTGPCVVENIPIQYCD